ncbi:hypothetical protein EIN_009270 [Entamoeba invadens IP1]|uniref:Uncharacterized protein n=1 Tax=Entamoeba invadens IP1 TaxID=370355 RepID=L7FMV2_ENTIV|nr:hypothetical protein EIN_009270 [Entamoeba invadens IP1]ELP89921.1 hypothetical protein EIN_009270 [Entamoeba invadens IP1]|eukprot:XP_004256692.1 hypothetical protein EIN_009270 [Entamoeba invadens IP1]
MREHSDSDGRSRQVLREQGELREHICVSIARHTKKVLGALESKATKTSLLHHISVLIKRMFVSIKEASRLLLEANGVYTREHLELFVLPPRPTYLVKSEEESLPWNIQELPTTRAISNIKTNAYR